MTYGIQNRKGFILLTGEVGTGKTTLLNRLLDWLHGQRVATAYIFNSQLDVNQLFDFIMAEFEIPCESREKSQVLLRLNQWLLERYRAGETAVLIVDEAQNLVSRSARGNPAADEPGDVHGKASADRADRPAGARRKAETCRNCASSASASRCAAGRRRSRWKRRSATLPSGCASPGANGEPIFSKEAIQTVHMYSRGIPRVVNLLCEHALINAYVDSVRPVSGALVEEVAREFQLDEIAPDCSSVGTPRHASRLPILRRCSKISMNCWAACAR